VQYVQGKDKDKDKDKDKENQRHNEREAKVSTHDRKKLSPLAAAAWLITPDTSMLPPKCVVSKATANAPPSVWNGIAEVVMACTSLI
jgi:hypothetical protein